MIDMRRNPVDFVVGSHHAPYLCFFDSSPKWDKEIFPNHALRVIPGSCVRSTLRLSMYGEVLGRGEHMMAINQVVRPLQSLNGGNADARRQIGIFSISLFCPAPARITRQVEHRRERLIHTR